MTLNYYDSTPVVGPAIVNGPDGKPLERGVGVWADGDREAALVMVFADDDAYDHAIALLAESLSVREDVVRDAVNAVLKA